MTSAPSENDVSTAHPGVRDHDQLEPIGTTTAPDTTDSMAAWVFCIVIAALAARLILMALGPMLDNERAFDSESHRYFELGQNLKSFHTLALSGPSGHPVLRPLDELRQELGQAESKTEDGLTPEIYRTPGYPALIAAIDYLPLPRLSLLILQSVLSVLTVVLVFAAARHLLNSPRAAVVAALLVAVHPADAVAANTFATETVLAALILLGIWFIAPQRNRNPLSGFAAGLSFGAAALVNPFALAAGPIVAAWMFLSNRKLVSFVGAVVLLVASLSPPAAWMWRNHDIGFDWRLSSEPAINAYFYTANFFDISSRDGDWNTDWGVGTATLLDRLDTGQDPDADDAATSMRRNKDEDVFDAMRRLTFQRLTSAPSLAVGVLLRGAIGLFTDDSMAALHRALGLKYEQPIVWRERIASGDLSIPEGQGAAVAALSVLWLILNATLLLASLIGLGLMVFRRQFALILLLGGLLLFFGLLTAQTGGPERLRIAVLGIQAIAAASLFAPAPQRVRKRSSLREKAITHFEKERGPAPAREQPPTGRPI